MSCAGTFVSRNCWLPLYEPFIPYFSRNGFGFSDLTFAPNCISLKPLVEADSWLRQLKKWGNFFQIIMNIFSTLLGMVFLNWLTPMALYAKIVVTYKPGPWVVFWMFFMIWKKLCSKKKWIALHLFIRRHMRFLLAELLPTFWKTLQLAIHYSDKFLYWYIVLILKLKTLKL